MKKNYEELYLKLIVFSYSDVLTGSGENPGDADFTQDENELPFVPF